MRKVFLDAFTGIDGKTIDIGRVLWAAGAEVFLLAATLQLIGDGMRLFGHATAMELWGAEGWSIWGAGFCGLMGAGAGALALKARTEPGAPPPAPNIIMPAPASNGPNVTVNN